MAAQPGSPALRKVFHSPMMTRMARARAKSQMTSITPAASPLFTSYVTFESMRVLLESACASPRRCRCVP